MTIYVKIVDGVVAEGGYPYTYSQLRASAPECSWPSQMSDEQLAEYGVLPVTKTPRPAINPITQRVIEDTPILVEGQWTLQWLVEDLNAATIAANQQAASEQLMVDVMGSTQARLDDFARTRNYDSILSATTYATSGVLKFAAEGQYCVDARDATWATLYALLSEIQAGTRAMPAGYRDIEPLLPVLEWPA